MHSFYPYSPRKASLEELTQSFVAREVLLEELLSSIREQADAESLQHWMILGTRGMGKSHIITMIYHTVKNDAGLKCRWMPILMHEEEQSVFSLHTLFIRYLTKLGEELAETDRKKSDTVFRFIDSQRSEDKKPEEILESVVAFLKDFVAETGQKLLVLMENSDDIFSRYIPGKNEIKKFRNMLQHDNFMLLIGTSPTFFDEISKTSAPLYQFFRIRTLDLLSYEQSVDLLNRWEQSDKNSGDKNSVPLVFHEDDYKLRVLWHLTGGNPRILLFLYMAINGQDGIQSAVNTFSRLLEEDLSNYYLSRMRDLSNQVQPIVLALAESDKNMTQKEIALKTFLPQKSIGTAMLRLEKDGLIKPVTEKKGKNTLYTLTDQLFRLWHQWRISIHNKEVIKAIVMCLAVWYKREELERLSMSSDITGIHCKEALKYRTTEHFRSLWEPFYNESETEIMKYLDKEDYTRFDKTLALLQETGLETEQLLGKVAKDLEGKGDLDKAAKILVKKLEIDNEDKKAWLDLGRVNFKQKNYAGAETAFEKVVEIDPKDKDAWQLLGGARFVQKDYASAEAAFEKVVEIDPRDKQVWKWLGHACGAQKDYAGAEAAFEKAVKIDPKDKEVLKWLGLVRGIQEDYVGTEAAFEKAVEMDPEDKDAWKWLGRVRFVQKDYAGAETAFEKAVEIDSNDKDKWTGLGIIRVIQENYAGAEAAFEKAMEIDPKYKEAWKWLGRACGNQDDYGGAEAALEKAVEIDPKDKEAWTGLGVARFLQNNYAGAGRAFRKLIEIEPLERENYLYLLEVLVKDKRVSDMLSVFEKAFSTKDSGDDFRSLMYSLRAFVFLYQQDRTPFLNDLNAMAKHLEKVSEEKRHEILGKITDFLIDTLQKDNIQIHRIYISEIRRISTELSGVFRPMDYVLDYFEVMFSDEKDIKARIDKAQRIVDSITSEIRGPVETMIQRINPDPPSKKIKTSLCLIKQADRMCLA
ncbi:MAG: tetratricopeptide repeat protein [Desulfobacterales bacterium]|nr:tetratricopeptide repeat protein [Desulfobacterales bacterium]